MNNLIFGILLAFIIGVLCIPLLFIFVKICFWFVNKFDKER